MPNTTRSIEETCSFPIHFPVLPLSLFPHPFIISSMPKTFETFKIEKKRKNNKFNNYIVRQTSSSTLPSHFHQFLIIIFILPILTIFVNNFLFYFFKHHYQVLRYMTIITSFILLQPKVHNI